MQNLPFQMERLLSARVHSVPQQRMSDARHMYPDLVCPAGLQLTLDVCILAKALQHAVVCHSALPVPLIYCHFFAVDRMASDRRIHRPPRVLHIPVHDSPVSSGNVVCFEQLCDRIVRLVIFAHNDGSGGVFIDPVDDPRAHNPLMPESPPLQ